MGTIPLTYRTVDIAQTVFASAARTETVTSGDFEVDPTMFRGVVLILDITAMSGTSPSLQVYLERKDPVTGKYTIIPDAATAIWTTTVIRQLVVYPGVAARANERASDVAAGILRATAIIGGTTPSVTFSLTAIPVR